MGRGRQDKVHLTMEQKDNLEQISRNGHASAKKILHARILLMCDEGEQAYRKWTDEEIAEVLQVHRNTVGRIRQRFLQKGEQPALERQPRTTPPTPPKVDGATVAQIIALCCSDPPQGRAEWTLRLLTSELKKRQIITEISRGTVWRTLKKTNYALGKPNDSVFPNGISLDLSLKWKSFLIFI
jgi:transposase